ncbi:uncharacterized protein TNCV_3443181 [Trichonephila clavipes]|nr:uncharacterized protein TNCV_3443181 [Trichonephila clavipes]
MLSSRPGAIYQQDNARPHTARLSQQYLQGYDVLPWPARSPDLSPIEHVWDALGRQLQPFRDTGKLTAQMQRLWQDLPQGSKQFREGCESCKDDPRPGQSFLAIIPNTIAPVDELIRQERRISIDELAECVNISHDFVDSIIHDHLGCWLLCPEWIPKLLNDRQKMERFGAALAHLICYYNEVDGLLVCGYDRK